MTHKRSKFVSSRFILVVAVVVASFLAAFLGQIFITQLSLSPSLLPEPGIIVRSQEEASQLRQAAQDIVQSQRSAFVRLYQRNNRQEAVPGWVVSSDGWIMYMAQTGVNDESVANVRLDNGEVYDVQQRLSDPATDLRFVKIDRERLSPLTISQDEVPALFESLLVVSGHGEFSRASMAGSGINDGILSSDRIERLPRVHASAPVGKAVYNKKGEVVGLLQASTNESTFALLPSAEIRSVLTMVLSSSAVKRASLGVSYVDLAHASALYPDLPPSGALVVEPPSVSGAAFRAGLRLNDVITASDGIPLSERYGLSDALSAVEAGEAIELTVERRGSSVTITVPVTEFVSE